ncbi:putative sugar transferase EpsL [Fusobacterium necrophorum]|nr:sugar transferase [Fusobacterium necrophorum]MBR8823889.1 putative sugar transferase EpsL [Fusobacterium necrophorum]
MYCNFIKRLIDIVFSIVFIFCFWWVYVILFILIFYKIGRPVFFKQNRPGKDEKIFTMYKFRTMTNNKDSHGNLLPDNERITKLGKILRNTSLDEIPEIWNVLKGNMSLVGPRPLLVEYLVKYNSKQKRRHEMKPGITGLAQIRGRNAITWEEKFNFDIEYVEKCSFLLDVYIIFQTIKKVLIREGINQNETTTMEKFQGSEYKDE